MQMPILPAPTESPAAPEYVFPRRGKIPSLDGWRGIAILIVLLDHCQYATRTGRPDDGWQPWLAIFDGNLGVRIFFVLSGLLITFLLLREAHDTSRISLRSFYARRSLRILPLYYAYLGVLGGLTVLGWYHDSLSSWLGALTFTRNFVGLGDSATTHFWTLAIEEQFYLLWPLCFTCLALWKKPRLYLAALLLVVVACPIFRLFIDNHPGGTLRGHLFHPDAFWMQADALAVGCLGAWPAWHWRGHRWHPTAACGVAVASLLGIGFSLWILQQPVAKFPLVQACQPTLQCLAILGLIWVSVRRENPWLFRALNFAPLAWLGVVSYSMYVWHMLFLGYFMKSPLEFWPTHDFRWWYVGALALACSSYYGLERPILRIKARLHPARFADRARPVSD